MASSFNNKTAKILLQTLNLKACKSVKFRFNPWKNEAKSIRMIFSNFYSPTMRNTNGKCSVTTDVRSDNSDPEIEIAFIDGTSAIFKTKALTAFDIASHFNRLSVAKAPKEEAEN